MKMIKTAFAAVFAVFVLNTCSYALESSAVGQVYALGQDAALQPAVPLPAPDAAALRGNDSDPVVITVAGLNFGEIGWGPLELRNFIRLFRLLFPEKTISENDLINDLVAFNKDYFALETDEDVNDLIEASGKKSLPDNYVETTVLGIQGYGNHTVVLSPFPWSRDPGDTEKVVPELEKKIIEVYDAYRNTGRPIHILAHSWGSVLSHEALHRVGRLRPDVKVARLITIGSPLVPANFVLKLFVKLKITQESLEKAVTKPAAVGTWHNVWVRRDAYSNSIPAADFNYQADSKVENVEPALKELILHNKQLRKAARRDLYAMRDLKAWHYSYFFDYKTLLKSLDKEIDVQILRPVLAPRVMDGAENPGPVRAP